LEKERIAYAFVKSHIEKVASVSDISNPDILAERHYDQESMSREGISRNDWIIFVRELTREICSDACERAKGKTFLD